MNEFDVNIVDRGTKVKKIEIHFPFGQTHIFMDLSYKEWMNLLKFLKTTLSRTHLPKTANGYFEFDIDWNRIGYDTMTEANFLLSPQRWSKEDRKRHALRTRRTLSTIRKTMLSDEMRLRNRQTFFYLSRSKFIRFRTFCLNPKNHYHQPKPEWMLKRERALG